MRDGLGSVQTVLLLGGTSEIGLAAVRALVAERARSVVLAGRDAPGLETAAGALRAAGAGSVEVLPLDAEDTASHSALLERAFARDDDVDVVIVAVGTLGDEARAQREAGAALDILRTNLLGPVSLVTEAAERLRRQGHGAIVVLSSVAAERPRRSNFVYGASKAGLDSYAQGLGDSLAGTGVSVLVVRPGFVRTKMTRDLKPAPLATDADRVAAAVVAGLRSGAHTVWAPAPLRWVMLALRLVPRALFRRLPI